MSVLKVLSILPNFSPSSVIYSVKPFLSLQDERRIRFRARTSRLFGRAYIDWADVVVFCRNTEDYDLGLLDYARNKNKKIIYNLDDNFFRIEPDTPIGDTAIGRLYLDPARRGRLREFLSRADLVLVYSEQILKDAGPFNGNVVLLKGYFDFSLTAGRVRKAGGQTIRITYATSRQENDYLQPLITEAVEYISAKYADSVEFHIFGSRLSVRRKNIHYVPMINHYDTFVRRFYDTGCSIGLAPMVDDLFHRSKTNIKYREYGACGIAGVYSDVGLYRASVRDGVNGLLVENRPDAWIAATERLINDVSLRKRIADSAYRDILDNYPMADFCHRLMDAAEGLFSRPPEGRLSRGEPAGDPPAIAAATRGLTPLGSRKRVLVVLVTRLAGVLETHGFAGTLAIAFRFLCTQVTNTTTALRITYLGRY